MTEHYHVTSKAEQVDGKRSDVDKKLARRGLMLFFVLLVLLSATGFILAIGYRYPLGGALFMCAPGLASIVTRIVLREGIADISLRLNMRRSWKLIVLSLFFPVLVGLLAYGTAWMTGWVDLEIPVSSIVAAPAVHFGMLLLFQMSVGTAIGMLSSLGEELGWRGYMLTTLIRAEVPYPLLVSGIIWGLWHVPVILAGAYYNGPYLALSLILFMVTVTSAGYVVGYIRLQTGSIWPAVIFHAAWNAIIQDVFDAISKGSEAFLWTGESGILVAVVIWMVACVISRRTTGVKWLQKYV
ncbi:type II CAAX prenyl endopeptidase Rce1 family protein [Paenibacillus sp. WLX2291]|uniref:CPBP family glutamic-type intramembrane protease n=1 Tax=Paenibacillus sp. WLX2291 TaxID=3296934 RepID=UPI00398447D0